MLDQREKNSPFLLSAEKRWAGNEHLADTGGEGEALTKKNRSGESQEEERPRR